MKRLLHELQAGPAVHDVGTKTRGCQWLMNHGFRVPNTWYLTFDACSNLLETDGARVQLEDEIEHSLELGSSYAVRSSADVEDDPDASFAGQFESRLDVRGAGGIADAVGAVIASAASEQVARYARTRGIGAIRMSVIIQEMVPADLSGVAFSRNPLTGLDEVVLESVSGSGTRLVQDGENPDRWIFKWGALIGQQPEGSLRTSVEGIARDVRQMEVLTGRPVDVEWVHDGHTCSYVQIRPIQQTEPVNLYSNRISREFLPGLIKPLVWSVNIPLVNGAWIRIFEQLLGNTGLAPGDLTKAFHYRAYFNMGAVGRVFSRLGMPRESLEIMMGFEGGPDRPQIRPSMTALRFLPRIVLFLIGKVAYGQRVRRQTAVARLKFDQIRAVLDQLLTSGSSLELIELSNELFRETSRLAYHNIVVPVLANVFMARLRRKFGDDAPDPLAGQDTGQFSPNRLLDDARELCGATPLIHRNVLVEGGYDALKRLVVEEPSVYQPILAVVEEIVERFGHLSDSGNDFSQRPWRENPDLVVRLVAGQSATPDAAPDAKHSSQDNNVAPRAARRYALLRESVSNTYTYGYGLFRGLFLGLGARLVASGHLRAADDIMFVTRAEVEQMSKGLMDPGESLSLTTERRTRYDRAAGIALPEVIYGDEEPPLLPESVAAGTLVGAGTSRGYYTGPARRIRSVDEGHLLVEGEVLVIPYSEVGWTSFFHKAGAVVAEAGGLLSHSSIVAREHGIPCVVGVSGAMTIGDQSQVTVDGYTGTVTVERGGND